MPRKNRAAEVRAQIASKKLREEREREEAHRAELREKYGVEDEEPSKKKAPSSRAAAMRKAMSIGAARPAGLPGTISGAGSGSGSYSRGSPATEGTAKSGDSATLEEIPVLSFRKIDPLYSTLISGFPSSGAQGEGETEGPSNQDTDDRGDELQNFIEEVDPASHSTYGYILRIPYAPGSEPCTGPTDPHYPKMSAHDILSLPQPFRFSRVPIVIFRTPKEISDFNARFKTFGDAQHEAALIRKLQEVLAVGGDVRILPPNQLIIYTPELEERVMKALKTNTSRVDSSHLSTKKMCLFLLGLLLVVGLTIAGLIFLMSKFFPQYINFGGNSAVSPEQRRLHALQVLGLTGEATEADVKRQYRKLAVQYHPDRNPNCVDCETRFIEIADAYKTISNILEGGTGSTEAKGNTVDYDRLYTVRPMRMR